MKKNCYRQTIIIAEVAIGQGWPTCGACAKFGALDDFEVTHYMPVIIIN